MRGRRSVPLADRKSTHPPSSTPLCAAVLLEDNEGAVAGRLLLETTVQGAKQLAARALKRVGDWLGTDA